MEKPATGITTLLFSKSYKGSFAVLPTYLLVIFGSELKVLVDLGLAGEVFELGGVGEWLGDWALVFDG